MPIPSGSFLQKFMNSKKTDGVSEPEVKKTLNPFSVNAMDRLTSIGSLREKASMMDKMNGTTDMMGMPSQGAQELAQNVEQNEKTAILQKVANFLNKINPFDRLFPDNRVEDPVSGQKVNPDFLKLLQNRPDLRERFDRTGSIYSDM